MPQAPGFRRQPGSLAWRILRYFEACGGQPSHHQVITASLSDANPKYVLNILSRLVHDGDLERPWEGVYQPRQEGP